MPSLKKQYRSRPAGSEEELRHWFRAKHQQLQNNPSVVESWSWVRRCLFLAGYCLGFSSDYTLDSIDLLIPPRMLNEPILYVKGESSKSAICIAVQSQNSKMTGILLDLGASLDVSCEWMGHPCALDYLTDVSDDVRKKFLQLFCEKRGKTDLGHEGNPNEVGHLLAALQLSPNAMDEWTPEICLKVVDELWDRRKGALLESDRELLAMMYASGRLSIDDEMTQGEFSGVDKLAQQLYRRQLSVLKFILRTLNADPNKLLKIVRGYNVFLEVFDYANFNSIFGNSECALDMFELVFCELMTPKLKASVLVTWVGHFLNQIIRGRNHQHPPNYVDLAVQRIVSLHHHNSGIFADLTNLLNQFVPRLLGVEESRNRAMFASEPPKEVHYDQSQVFILWKVMGASVPSARVFADIMWVSAYQTFARLVWMFGKDCPIHRVHIDFQPQLEEFDEKAIERESRCIEAFVRIMLRSTKRSADWFRVLEGLMVKKGVSTDSLLRDRMRLENMAAAVWNDCNREHPRNVNLPVEIRRIASAEKEFEILEKFGAED